MTGETLIHFLKLFAGIGLFLFAMYLLEESLKNLSGRRLKIFLQRITKNKIGAATGGALITGILQSSSMVSLMVLAFVGAGVFTMKNAMAIILGANLGTTLDSWLVASLGFKMNIEIIAYPVVGIGGLLLILLGNRKSVKYISYFLLGFGLLFIALSFMKTAMEDQVKGFDISAYAEMPMIVFLFIGFIITLLVQSSSVTMALALSAVHAGVIGFEPAAAIVIGSETGTTIKILLGAIQGNASKKRVAFGNFLFNVVLTVLAFLLLRPILFLITDVFGIHDPLIGLVTFSSMINLTAVIIFLPLLDPFATFLERFFKNTRESIAAFIGNADIKEPVTALDLFRRETDYFIHNSMLINLESVDVDTKFIQHPDFSLLNEKRKFFSMNTEEKYEFLKQLQGELQSFYLLLRKKLEDEQSSQLNQLISAVRSSMYAVKGIKDIRTNILNLSRSSENIKFDFFMHHKSEMENLYRLLNSFMRYEHTTDFEKLEAIYHEIQRNYTDGLNDFYANIQQSAIEKTDITTAMNFNRELFTSNKAMLMGVKDFLLDEKEAKDFNEIPVYAT